MNFSKYDLDWRSLLVKRYKNYGLDEKSLLVLLCLNEVLKDNPCLISAEELEWMMTISKDEIDAILASLLQKKFISFTQYNKKTITTIEPLITKIYEDTKKDIIIDDKDQSKAEAKSKGEQMYGYFEQLVGRPLTSLELERVCNWYREGATDGMVKEAVERVKSKSKRITINAVDKVLLSIQKSQDIKDEGFTTRSEDWRIGTEDTIAMIKGKWLDD